MRAVRLPTLLFAASLLGALALRNTDLGQGPWLISRASGLGAFGALSGSVVFGLLVRTKVADGLMPRPLTYELHQFLGVVGLVLTGLHAGALLFDSFLHFTPLSLVLPLASPYRPLAVAVGVLSAWFTATVTASSFTRRQLGQRRWRQIHFLAFAAYGLALVHGLTAGSDTALPAVRVLYATSTALVAALVTYRVMAARSPRTTPARRSAARSSPAA